MNKLLKGALAASGVLLVSGCSDTFDPSGDRVGRILPTVDLDTRVAAPGSLDAQALSRADNADAVSVSDLTLRLTATDGAFCQSYSDADALYGQEVPVGSYLLEAFYGNEGDEGYAKPYYYGSQNLSVLENKSTPVSVTASLANAIVTVRYSEAVQKYFTSCKAALHSASGADFAVDPTSADLLYVTPGQVDINVDVVRPTGVAASLSPYSFTAEARHHYYVTFDINEGAGAGDAFLKVTFNASTVDEEVEINISDQVLVSPAPTVTLSGIEGELDFIEGTTPAAKISATVVAKGGLKTVRLTTSSASLQAKGWPAEVDFATADASVLATLRNLGLSTAGLEGVKTQMAFLDFTEVIKNVSYIDGADNTTVFTIVAQDNLTKVSEPVSFSFATSRLELTLGDVEPLYLEETELVLMAEYNGNDFLGGVKFSYFNELGIWRPLTIKSATQVARASNSTYKVVLEVPAEGNLTFRAECGSIITPEVEVVRTEPTHSFAFNENDIFATRAMGTLVTLDGSDPAVALASARLFLSADGVKYEEVSKDASGSAFNLTGLTPATTYYMKGSVDGIICRPVTFTTEAALQLPNSNMDEWHSQNGKSKHQIWFYPWIQDAPDAVWNTYNPVTMSQGGSGTSGYAYKATSGTISTSNSKSGMAAQIRTVGWGSSNSASWKSGNRWNFGTCKYVSAGQLFLGNWENVNVVQNSIPNYGVSFTSRPSALSFWYKYAVMNKDGNDNGERGVAEITVYDADGNILATKTEKLEPNASYANIGSDNDWSVGGEYAQKTVSIDYPVPAAKAARISVIFKSTDYSNSELEANKNSSHMRPPRPLNLDSHIYLGASLLVDDITLNY